jgi:vancomycin resistance protein YoaR
VLLAEGDRREVPLALRRDDATLRALIEGIDRDITVQPQDAQLHLHEGDVVVVDDVAGHRLDIERAIADTVREVCTAKPATIALATVPIAPKLTARALEPAKREAMRLVSEPVLFTLDGDTYPVDTGTLTAALAIDAGKAPTLDPEALAPRLDEIAGAVAVAPRNVMLGWDGGLYVVEDDVPGQQVDREALEARVVELAGSTERTAALPVKPVRAEARTDNFDQLGIDGHLAYGASSFAGSSEARAANVAVSARNISYKLVAPGEQFSFNDLLGPITLDNGFVEGTIIQGDWAATDIGGGACQVSTTVFRAAALSGFDFTEWHPHSWRLGFYELDGSPPGFDGAIYQPNTPDEIEKDLTFTNPLDSWLLLMMVVDGDTVSAHFYGRDPGWTVEMGEAQLSEPKPIPDPVVRENARLAPGERVLVQNARAGVTVRIRRTVTAADGTILADGDFVSDFRSVPEAWEVGPS